MNDVLLFAGTTEGRRIAEAFKDCPIDLFVSVATEYGETLIEPAKNIHVLHGRKNAEQIETLIEETGAKLIIDATHPYAAEVTETLKAAAQRTQTAYWRVLRASEAADGCVTVDDTAAAVAYLNGTEGNVLLTVGSKELSAYTAVTDYKTRLYARVLPLTEAVEQANALGFTGAHLCAAQGPFSEEWNAAMLRAIDAKVLVTKDTGTAGGFSEKLRAAKALGVTPVVVRRPLAESGMSVEDCVEQVLRRFGVAQKKTVAIVGVGTGSERMLTEAAKDAIRAADLVIGAKRLTDALTAFCKPVEHAVAADEIERIIRASSARRIVVAMSGDTGFYSGTKPLLKRISDLEPDVLPGISSIVYLAAKCKTAWDDAAIASAHGRAANVVALTSRNQKLFLLTGKPDVGAILSELCEYGLSGVSVTVGENLSYPDERITRGTAAELSKRTFDPLAVLLIENPKAATASVTHGRADEAFLRGDVPMTKSEVRAVTLSKLRLAKDAVCWDVGAGTGSVSIEMAEAAVDGCVYAIEKNADACALIEQNKRHLGVSNVTVVNGAAPDALLALPAPTHVFIGGSGGNLQAIIEAALTKNPRARIVLNTVTAETFAEATAAIRELNLVNEEIVELNVSRARKAGAYHLMTALNPVYVIACEGGESDA